MNTAGRDVRFLALLAAICLSSGPLSVAAAERSSDDSPQDRSNATPSSTETAASAPASTATAAAPTEEPATPPGAISIDFKDADVRQVLRIISLKSGVDIVAGPDVEGLVSIKLTNVPWEQALDIILRTYGFAYERKENVVRVMSRDSVEQEALATEVFPLGYAKAKDVSDIIKGMLSDRGKVKSDDRTNTVVISDLPSTLFQYKQVIERLDQATPQVRIESKFVEARLTRDENLGVDWFDSVSIAARTAIAPTTFPFPGGADLGEPGSAFIPKPGAFSPSSGASLSKGRIPETGGTFTFGTIDLGTLTTTLNMLKSRVDTKVISHPTIVTLNNKEASVQVGTDVNIPNFQIDPSTGRATVSGFQTRSTGIMLKVTPHINPQEEIVLDVKPEITTVGSDRTFASGITFPDFDVQKAETQVRLTDGQTLAIGGLKRQSDRVTVSKVPLLGDIPLLGALFSNRRQQTPSGQDELDLLVFLTVQLVRNQPKATKVAAQPPPMVP